MSPDLKIATVFVMPLGGSDVAQVPKILGSHAKFLRGELGRNIELKFTPDLRFRIDESFAEGARIDALLRSPFVKQDIKDPE
jgi:ribosome-binding factor A